MVRNLQYGPRTRLVRSIYQLVAIVQSARRVCLSVTHLVKQMKDLVSNYKETVVLRGWESEKRKFGVKLIDTDKITIVS